ncbi:MAG: hypothetical protein AAGG02_10715 [Cyanobacteria bacterium P01_H01_bin.15]
MTTSELKALLENNLDSSSSSEEILSFFDSRGWIHDFDEYEQRFFARDPVEDEGPEVFGRNQIYVYVDANGFFVKAEVVRVFPGL